MNIRPISRDFLQKAIEKIAPHTAEAPDHHENLKVRDFS